VRIRTADPFITSEVLYQLSYVGNTDVIQQTVARSCTDHSGVVRAGIVPAWDRIGAFVLTRAMAERLGVL
jgi:hypothetical protein